MPKKTTKAEPITLIRLEIVDYGSRLEVIASQPDARAVSGRHERSAVKRNLADAWRVLNGYATAMVQGKFIPPNKPDQDIQPPDLQLDEIDEPQPKPAAVPDRPGLFEKETP